MQKIERKVGFFEKNAAIFKLVLIMVLSLLLLIPKFFVNDLVRERLYRKGDTYNSIKQSWGESQHATGPVLYVPVEYERIVEKKKEKKANGEIEIETKKEVIRSTKYLHILPEKLAYNGTVDPVIKYKSIYEFILYSSDLSVSGDFKLKPLKEYNLKDGKIIWDKAFMIIGISSMKGITEAVKMNIDGKDYEFGQNSMLQELFESSLSTKLKIGYKIDKVIKFDYRLKLNGSSSLQFLPIGKETSVELRSEWPHPNFFGNFLPIDRDIKDSGFTAAWKVIDLNRNFPQHWLDGDLKNKIYNSTFGVALANPVDGYRKIERSVKYLLLFVSLTFLIFFLTEVLSKKRIHIIAYLLVGFALLIFYVLLIAISEHMLFDISYIISSAATITLIGWYSTGIIKSKKFALMISSALTVLYIFLYILLQNQDYSLLFGSLGLFLALSITMYATRNIDWYNIKNEKDALVGDSDEKDQTDQL